MTDAPVLDQAALQRILRIGGPALLRKLVDMYLELGPGRLQALADGVAAHDADQIRRAAHTMKSTAGNVGAARLQHSAERAEQLASEGVIDADIAARIPREFDESAAALRLAVEELGT